MSKDADFALRMATDATLKVILTGEVWTPSGYILPPAIVVAHAAGTEGISRETTPDAFDASGWLKPCALVRQAGRIPDSNVKDYDAQIVSTNQRVEVWLYEDQSGGYSKIDAAAARIYVLFQGYTFDDSFEVYLANDLDRQRDEGALKGASLRRLDFVVPSILEPAGG